MHPEASANKRICCQQDRALEPVAGGVLSDNDAQENCNEVDSALKRKEIEVEVLAHHPGNEDSQRHDENRDLRSATCTKRVLVCIGLLASSLMSCCVCTCPAFGAEYSNSVLMLVPACGMWPIFLLNWCQCLIFCCYVYRQIPG